jgi:hypothetical protein
MAGAVNRKLLIAVLAVACGVMAYRLFFPAEKRDERGVTGATAKAAGAPARTKSKSSAGKSEANAMLDPTLRLDLLDNSRAVNYSGSKRNIFLISGGASTGAASGSTGSASKGPGSASGAAQKPPDAPPVVEPPRPPVAPPVVIPLKFYGIAERSGGTSTKALLTSGETIVIAQVGQTVAQHFRIVKIGPTKLELEDVRDHQAHSIPLEDDSRAAGAAAGGPPAKPE